VYSALATNLPLSTTQVLGSKQNKLIETCRKLHIEELLNLSSTLYNIWAIKYYKSSAAYGTHGAEEKYHRVLVRKHVRKRLLGRPRLRGENNIKVYIEETKWEFVNKRGSR